MHNFLLKSRWNGGGMTALAGTGTGKVLSPRTRPFLNSGFHET